MCSAQPCRYEERRSHRCGRGCRDLGRGPVYGHPPRRQGASPAGRPAAWPQRCPGVPPWRRPTVSTQAMHWALYLADLKPAPWRVLMLLCDAANSESGVAWLSVPTIVRRSGLARSTVIKSLQELHSAGYLVPGDRRYVSHLPKDQRPNVWQPNIWRGTPSDLRGDPLPLDQDGAGPIPGPRPIPGRGGGPIPGRKGVRSSDPNQELEPTYGQVPTPSTDRARDSRVSDLGVTTPGAVPPSEALARIAACRAALRKEQPA